MHPCSLEMDLGQIVSLKIQYNNVYVHCRSIPRAQKVPSGHLGQVDSPSWQETFHFHLSNGQEIESTN